MNHPIESLKKNHIVFATVSDSLGEPYIQGLIDYPEYTVVIKNSLELRGIDEAELRILEIDKTKKEIRCCFHASSRLNPQVSTGRAILLTYVSMRNTVYHSIYTLFSR